MAYSDDLDSPRDVAAERQLAQVAKQAMREEREKPGDLSNKKRNLKMIRRRALKLGLLDRPKMYALNDGERRVAIVRSVVAEDGLWVEVQAFDGKRPIAPPNAQTRRVTDEDGQDHMMLNPIRIDDPAIGDNPMDELINLMTSLRRNS